MVVSSWTAWLTDCPDPGQQLERKLGHDEAPEASSRSSSNKCIEPRGPLEVSVIAGCEHRGRPLGSCYDSHEIRARLGRRNRRHAEAFTASPAVWVLARS